MKASTIILGALAAVATAAPTQVEKRNSRDFSSFGNFGGINNFDFLNQDLQYLGLVNSLDFALLAQLSAVNNFDVFQFGGVFNNDVFDLAAALQFQQIAQLVQLSSLGAFNSLDLSGLVLNQLNFGVLQNDLFGLNLGGFVNQAVIPQVVQVINAGGAFVPASGFASGGFASGGFSSGSFSSSGSSVDVSQVSQPASNAAPGSFVTADEFNAQEGSSSLPKN